MCWKAPYFSPLSPRQDNREKGSRATEANVNRQELSGSSAKCADMRSSNILSFSQPGAVHPVRRLGPGKALFHEGDHTGWFYEVVSGLLKLSKLTSAGRLLIDDFLVAVHIDSLVDI